MEKVQAAFACQQNPSSTPAQVKDANVWLEQFQGTTEAWQVADQLLALEVAGNGLLTAAQIFAAQTMRTKIQYDFAELPTESHHSLRNSLLGHVVRFAPVTSAPPPALPRRPGARAACAGLGQRQRRALAMLVPSPQLSALSASPSQGPQPVLTQLCLAVALLALHMESWLTVVPDLISNLTTPPEQAAVKLPCLLELLTVLPEEVENFKVGIMPRRRQAFREMLKAAGQQVLQLLLQVCEQCRGQDVIMKRQLRCLSSWLRNAWLPSDQLAASPIMALAFASIASPELFECATDVLVDAVHFSHDHEEHQQLIGLIVPQVLQLVPMYEESLRQEDDDTCRALCRIFTETGEQYLHLILRDPQQALPVVSAVLRGAAHPDREVAEITFNFWYILSEELAGGGRMLEPSQRAACRQLFVPAFVQLVDSLRLLVLLPADSDTWSVDDRDDFKRFRYSVGDVLSDACKVTGSTLPLTLTLALTLILTLTTEPNPEPNPDRGPIPNSNPKPHPKPHPDQVMGSVQCLERIFTVLQATLPQLAAAPAAHWRQVEGCVYCMRQMVAANRVQDPAFFGAEVVGSLMRLLPTLPAVGELQVTSIRTVGTYAHWFGSNAELLPQMLAYVSQGLAQETMAAAAAQSMKQLCDACSEHLADESSMAQLLQMYHGTLRLALHNADRVDLVSALSYVVSQLAPAQVPPAIHTPTPTEPEPRP